MKVTVGFKNINGEKVERHFEGITRISRGVLTSDLLLYDGREIFPHVYQKTNIDGVLRIENATVNCVAEE